MTDASIPAPRRAPAGEPVSRVDTNVVARDHAVRHEIQPRLAALCSHLTLFAHRANASRCPVSVTYEIEGMGALRAKESTRFAVETDDAERPSRVAISFDNVGTGQLSAVPRSSDAYFQIRDHLGRNDLRFSSSIAGNVGKITLAPEVPVEMAFTADMAAGVIRVSVKNLVAIGPTRYTLDPACLDVRLIGEIEKLLRYEPSRFYELTGNGVRRPAPQPAPKRPGTGVPARAAGAAPDNGGLLARMKRLVR